MIALYRNLFFYLIIAIKTPGKVGLFAHVVIITYKHINRIRMMYL